MRASRPYLGYRGFATVLGGCVAYVADYGRSDPPVSGSLWHICATAWGPKIFFGNDWPLGVEFRASARQVPPYARQTRPMRAARQRAARERAPG